MTRAPMNHRLSSPARLAILSAILAAAGPALAADPVKGKEKHEQICASCHGKDAATPIDPSYPKLAGQYPDYLVQTLKDYRSGARKNPIMGGIAKTLSNDDMKNLAAYYQNLESSLHTTPASIRFHPQP